MTEIAFPKIVVEIHPKGFKPEHILAIQGQSLEFENLSDKKLLISSIQDKKPTSKVFGEDSFDLKKDNHGTLAKLKAVKQNCPQGAYLLQAGEGVLTGEMTAHLEVISPPDCEEETVDP